VKNRGNHLAWRASEANDAVKNSRIDSAEYGTCSSPCPPACRLMDKMQARECWAEEIRQVCAWTKICTTISNLPYCLIVIFMTECNRRMIFPCNVDQPMLASGESHGQRCITPRASRMDCRPVGRLPGTRINRCYLFEKRATIASRTCDTIRYKPKRSRPSSWLEN
jgi:hypothetical protein